MPARSKSQQRLFGMVHAYQKGKLKNAPEEVKEIARSISFDDAEHFAKTKHKGLPEKKAAINLGVKGLHLNDIKNILGSLSNEERQIAKSIIRSTNPGTRDRSNAVLALYRAIKPEKWVDGGTPKFMRRFLRDVTSGNPYIFRGAHNPSEPLHILGKDLVTSGSGLDYSRYVLGTGNLRHFTPWPTFARTYTLPYTGMNKVKGGDFGHLSVYRAKDFPAIRANIPNDGFTQQYGGLTKAQFRAMSPEKITKTLEEQPWLDWAAPGKAAKKTLPKRVIDDIKEFVHDTRLEGRNWRRTLRSEMLDARIRRLSKLGPLDQLRDKYVRGYIGGSSSIPARVKKDIEHSLEKGDLGNYLHEMVLDIRGVRPSGLIMTKADGKGTYFDVTRLMRLYQDSVANGNKKLSDAIGNLFRKRFGYSVE